MPMVVMGVMAVPVPTPREVMGVTGVITVAAVMATGAVMITEQEMAQETVMAPGTETVAVMGVMAAVLN